MVRWLALFSLLFGLVCLGISLAHLAMGPASIPGSVPVNATMDSEDRFYATLLTGFAVAMIWASRDLAARRSVYLALMATFFLGGLARLVSVAMVGWPSPLFIFLGSLELLIPPACWLALRRALAD
jgi:hypothetical protein